MVESNPALKVAFSAQLNTLVDQHIDWFIDQLNLADESQQLLANIVYQVILEMIVSSPSKEEVDEMITSKYIAGRLLKVSKNQTSPMTLLVGKNGDALQHPAVTVYDMASVDPDHENIAHHSPMLADGTRLSTSFLAIAQGYIASLESVRTVHNQVENKKPSRQVVFSAFSGTLREMTQYRNDSTTYSNALHEMTASIGNQKLLENQATVFGYFFVSNFIMTALFQRMLEIFGNSNQDLLISYTDKQIKTANESSQNSSLIRTSAEAGALALILQGLGYDDGIGMLNQS